MTRPIRTNEDALAYIAEHAPGAEVVEIKGAPYVRETIVCKRCGGSGIYSVFHGVCYDCGGRNSRYTHHHPVVSYAQGWRRRETAAARREKQAAARLEARLERQRDVCEAEGKGRITFSEAHQQRAAERQAKRDAARAEKVARSHHVGTVKKREVFDLTLRAVPSWDGSYGTTYCHIFETDSGAVVIWKTGEPLGGPCWMRHVDDGSTSAPCRPCLADAWLSTWEPMAPGTRVSLRATVKEHGERDGVAQTIITRAKVEGVQASW